MRDVYELIFTCIVYEYLTAPRVGRFSNRAFFQSWRPSFSFPFALTLRLCITGKSWKGNFVAYRFTAQSQTLCSTVTWKNSRCVQQWLCSSIYWRAYERKKKNYRLHYVVSYGDKNQYKLQKIYEHFKFPIQQDVCVLFTTCYIAHVTTSMTIIRNNLSIVSLRLSTEDCQT